MAKVNPLNITMTASVSDLLPKIEASSQPIRYIQPPNWHGAKDPEGEVLECEHKEIDEEDGEEYCVECGIVVSVL